MYIIFIAPLNNVPKLLIDSNICLCYVPFRRNNTMPFFEPVKNTNYPIDFDKYIPAEVLMNHTTEGRIRPEIVRFSLPDESIVTKKIDNIRTIKEKPNTNLYYCMITHNKTRREILLVYHIRQHQWVMAKPN